MVLPNASCEQCKSSGLPILFVRYAVVPRTVRRGLPGWAGAERVSSVALGNDFQYALRTLREGYVYIFYERNARGSRQWECYAVGQDGCLKLQPSPQAALPQATPVLQCSRDGHSNLQVHYAVVEQPQKCGAVWVAFSQSKWSDETLKTYTVHTALRNKRMQTLHPSAMAGGSKHSHGNIAEQAVLEGVLEYAPDFNEADLPHRGAVPELSREDGSLRDASLPARMSTRYPWSLRKGTAGATVENMKRRAVQSDGKHNTPHVVALWDAVGIAHELNGFRNDAAGWIRKFGDERALQITAANAVDGTRKALEQQAFGNANDALDMPWRWTSNDSAERLQNTAATSPQRQVNERELVRRWEQDARDRVPGFIAQRRMAYVNGSAADFASGMQSVDAERTKLLAERSADPQYALRRSEYVSRAVKGAWNKYGERVDVDALNTFKVNWSSF